MVTLSLQSVAYESVYPRQSWWVCTVQIGNTLTRLYVNASAYKWQKMNRLPGFSQLATGVVTLLGYKFYKIHKCSPPRP